MSSLVRDGFRFKKIDSTANALIFVSLSISVLFCFIALVAVAAFVFIALYAWSRCLDETKRGYAVLEGMLPIMRIAGKFWFVGVKWLSINVSRDGKY